MNNYLVVEKLNENAVHGVFDSLQRAKSHITQTIPLYVQRGYFTDKTLNKDSFCIKVTK